jgi:hypothetical protein
MSARVSKCVRAIGLVAAISASSAFAQPLHSDLDSDELMRRIVSIGADAEFQRGSAEKKEMFKGYMQELMTRSKARQPSALFNFGWYRQQICDSMKQPVGVLAGAALPRSVRIAEVDLHARLRGQLGVARHLAALVVGQAVAHRGCGRSATVPRHTPPCRHRGRRLRAAAPCAPKRPGAAPRRAAVRCASRAPVRGVRPVRARRLEPGQEASRGAPRTLACH